jgi:hypothetical protein
VINVNTKRNNYILTDREADRMMFEKIKHYLEERRIYDLEDAMNSDKVGDVKTRICKD